LKVSRSKLQLILSATIGILLLGGMFWYVGFDKLLAAMAQVSPLWLLFSELIFLSVHLVRAWRWKLLLMPVKNPISMSNALWATTVGFLVNALIPVRLGDFIRAFILKEKEKIGFASVFSSIVVELILNLSCLLTSGLILVLMLPAGISIPPWLLGAFEVAMVFLAVILTAIFVGTKREDAVLSLFDRFLSLTFKPKLRDKMLSAAKGFIQGAKALSQSPQLLLKALTLTYIVWLPQLLGIWFIFKAFGYQAPLTIIFLGALIVVFSLIFPASPGYVGTYEAYWLLIFSGLGLTGVDQLLAMGIISHIIGLVAMMAPGCVGVVWLGLSFEELFKIRRPEKT